MKPDTTYQAIVNDTFEFTELDSDLDISVDKQGHYHLLVDGRAHRAELVSADWSRRLIEIRLNGQLFQIKLKDEADLMVERLGLNTRSRQETKNITAPMPGLVLKIPAGNGQTVTSGEVLIVLEAMKMENAIKAPADGTIKALHVTEGEAVEKKQLLIEME